MMIASGNGFTEIVKMLLEKGANVNAQDKTVIGLTPLMIAADEGHSETVKMLLDKGADKDFKNPYGLKAADNAKTPAIRDMIINYKK